MRDRRFFKRRPGSPRRRAGSSAVADDRAVAPSRPRRPWCVDRRSRRSGALTAVDHRPVAGRPSADGDRRWQCVDHLQRRSLQLCRNPIRVGRSRLHFPQPQRHRSCRQRLACLGSADFFAAPRDVRPGALGSPRAPADLGARPDRQEAGVLGAHPLGIGFWLGNQGVAHLARYFSHAGPQRDRSLSDASVRAGADDRFCRREQIAGRPLFDCRGRWRRMPRRARAGALLGTPSPKRKQRPAQARRTAPRARRTAGAGGTAAIDFRRAARRVSVGRGRLVRRRRDDGAGRRRPGQDLLDRLCRQAIRRDPLCPHGGRKATAPIITS